MIELTRLNGRPMVLNSDLIKTAEASPDTMLTLINGEKLIVREEIGEVVETVLAYRARLLAVRGQATASLRRPGARRRHWRAWIGERAAHGDDPGFEAGRAILTQYRSRRGESTRGQEHMDKASIGGAFLAIAGIVAGLLIEGGNLGQILQPTAALIVFGGTLGAVLLQFPLTTVVAAFRKPGASVCCAAQGGDPTDSRAGGVCQQGTPARRGFAGCRFAGHSGSVSEADPDAGRGRHRARGTAQDHARESGIASPRTRSGCPQCSSRPEASRLQSAFWARCSA